MNNINLIFSAAVLAAGSAVGVIKILIFFILLMLVFWGINIYKHAKSGKWTTFMKIVDIVGVLFLAVMIILLIVPLFKAA